LATSVVGNIAGTTLEDEIKARKTREKARVTNKTPSLLWYSGYLPGKFHNA
jgi:hypothetical protein